MPLARRIERRVPFLDVNVVAVQEGSDAWCEEPGIVGRAWCVLSQRYGDSCAPEGWFFLYESIGSRKTIADLVRHECMQVKPAPFTLADGSTPLIARIVEA
jgi:hypothetical protein